LALASQTTDASDFSSTSLVASRRLLLLLLLLLAVNINDVFYCRVTASLQVPTVAHRSRTMKDHRHLHAFCFRPITRASNLLDAVFAANGTLSLRLPLLLIVEWNLFVFFETV